MGGSIWLNGLRSAGGPGLVDRRQQYPTALLVANIWFAMGRIGRSRNKSGVQAKRSSRVQIIIVGGNHHYLSGP